MRTRVAIEDLARRAMLERMTTARAVAYRRVLQTLRDIGPAKLWPKEQACIREAADALLFCADLANDNAARHALAAIAALTDDLVEADRWTAERARRLLDDVWACGPARAFGLPIAA
jgi:hypothetical protein